MNFNNGNKDVTVSMVRIQPEGDNILPEPSDQFVSSPYVDHVIDRALAYLQADYPIHFSGVAGTGKTTLAFHAASKLGRPVMLIHGDDEFGSSDLIGKDGGYRKSKLVDNYIHSVLKTEEEMKSFWVNNRLTTACQRGYTLIYDEFNRSRPEANNALLSVLSERILNLPSLNRNGDGYQEVHPNFRAIFTSNPEEYSGVHKTQDALMDRLITLQLKHYDRDTEIHITMSKSGISKEDAERIVDIVCELRKVGVNNSRPTIRACIAIAKILASRHARVQIDDPVFLWVCHDVLNMDTAKVSRDGQSLMQEKIKEVIQNVCGPSSMNRKDSLRKTLHVVKHLNLSAQTTI